MIQSPLSISEPIGLHNNEMKQLIVKILSYEKRVETLVAQKSKLKAGRDLDGVILEISELQKELIALRGQRQKLRDHMLESHPKEELLDDLSVLKNYEDPSRRVKEPGVDERLDSMIQKLRAQYVRTDHTYGTQLAPDESLEFHRKKKDLGKEVKEDYIKENIKDQLKID